jgi:hypothetical protein
VAIRVSRTSSSGVGTADVDSVHSTYFDFNKYTYAHSRTSASIDLCQNYSRVRLTLAEIHGCNGYATTVECYPGRPYSLQTRR